MSKRLQDLDPAAVPGARRSLGLDDFARLFGTSPIEIPSDLKAEITGRDFRYVVLEGEARDRTLLDVLRTIDSGTLSKAGAAGKARWDKGWAENLEAFVASGYDFKALVPKYIRPRQPVRLDQNYVLPVNPAFELDWYEIFRPWFLRTNLERFDCVFEFGCGSGFNLAALAQRDAKRRYVGLDWAAPSAEIVNRMAARFGWRMEGRVFDFFHPDATLDVPANSAFLTVGALEQTGRDWGAFLDFVLAKRPACVFHIEPICEWYDADNIVDYAAIRFHEFRNYWCGYPDRIAELAKAGRVEILKQKRSYFGSLFIEGYSQLVWRPLA